MTAEVGTRTRSDSCSVVLDGAWLRVAIVGRVTLEAITAFAEGLDTAIERGEPYVVLFDRRAMTGPTKDGRAALEQWGETVMPRVAVTCAGWADVYDERRAASLRRQDEAADAPDEDGASAASYPHQLFDDHAAAAAWLGDLLDRRAAAHPAS